MGDFIIGGWFNSNTKFKILQFSKSYEVVKQQIGKYGRAPI